MRPQSWHLEPACGRFSRLMVDPSGHLTDTRDWAVHPLPISGDSGRLLQRGVTAMHGRTKSNVLPFRQISI